jgi:phosphate transport system protein
MTTLQQHTVRAYDGELKELTRNIAEMGGLVEKLIVDSVDALLRQDEVLARSVVADDRIVDRFQHEIEDKAILLIARRQPLAVDLREVVAAIRISNDLERIGDMAKNNAKRGLALGRLFGMTSTVKGFDTLAKLALQRVKRVLDAYATGDGAAALDVWGSDSEIDALYNSLFRELLTYMMEDPRNIGACTHLLFCAKNLERIGDHATNIAETIHFVVTGETLQDERPKLDTTSVIMPKD